MKIVGFVVAFIIVLSACSKKNTDILDAKLVSVWEPDANFSSDFAMTGINYYNSDIIYPTRGDRSFMFVFQDLTGKTGRTVTVPYGKGPGEMQSHMTISVAEDKIVIYDYAASKVIVYGTDGKHIDDYNLDTTIGVPMTVAIAGSDMYINGKYDNKLIKYDLLANAVVKGIKYESNKTTVPITGDVFEGGWVAYDPVDELVYLGYYNRPFRLERYDTDLNLKDTLTVADADTYKKCTWYYPNPIQTTQIGDRVIAGIVFDENYVYASYGGGYEVAINDPNKPYEYNPSVVKISVFEKKTGRSVLTIGCQQLDGIRGFIKILGVTKENIILQIADMSDVTYRIMGKNRSATQNRNFAVVVLKNPMYDNNRSNI